MPDQPARLRAASGRFDSRARLFFDPDRLTDGRIEVRLYPQQTALLLALMGRPLLSRDDAAEIVWPVAAFMPDEWHTRLSTLFSMLRRNLKPFGWVIQSRYGQGWTLERHADRDSRAAEAQRQAA